MNRTPMWSAGDSPRRALSVRRFAQMMLLLLLPGVGGCGTFLETALPRDYEVKEFFIKPDPLEILQTSTAGDRRAKALRSLREPLAHGGTQEEQELVLRLLSEAAISDRRVYCRMAAIESLGRFQDARAASVLINAYLDARTFPPDQATRLQVQAITALGEVQQPEAMNFLVRLVNEPPTEGAEIDKQHGLDVRLAAVRALGKYQDRRAAEALLRVMETEKDVAVFDQAHASLKRVTGKRVPPDPRTWHAVVYPSPDQPLPADGPIQRVMNWIWE